MSEFNIGAKIRKLRHEKRLTLQKVSTEIGVSTALISQIENGHISPPIATLTKIARFFDVKMADFFVESEEPRRYEVFRASEQRSRMTLAGENGMMRVVEFFSGQPYAKKLAPQLIELLPMAQGAPGHSHNGEEFILVTNGKMTIHYGSQEIELDEGDSIYFDADTVHFFTADIQGARFLSIASRQP